MTRHAETPSRAVVRVLKLLVEVHPTLFFRTPPSLAKAMPALSGEVDQHGFYTCGRDDSLDPRADEVWTFDVPCGVVDVQPASRRAFIFRKQRAVWVNVGDLEPGLSGGLIYQIAGAYAHNNDWILIGDPDGITEAGKRRRMENMIALALKYNSTEFLRPHDDMLGWNGLLWGRDDNSNLYSLLRTSRKVVSKFYPEMIDARFDFNTARFHHDSVDIDAVAFSRLAAHKRASWGADGVGAPGGGTLRLAILFQSLVDAATDRRWADCSTAGDLCGTNTVGFGHELALCRY